MPKRQGLWRRGARYHTNSKVSKGLRTAPGREHIRKSLKTSNPREAVSMIPVEVVIWKTRFEKNGAS